MSELDKKKKSPSKKIAGIRGWIQAVATLFTNIHIPNLFKGKIYQGNAKTVCVPAVSYTHLDVYKRQEVGFTQAQALTIMTILAFAGIVGS